MAIGTPFAGFGQSKSEYQKQVFVHSDGGYLNYRLLEPASYSPNSSYPLVIFLHGAGERGSDNELQLVHGADLFLKASNRSEYPAFVVFPQCPENQAWANVDRWNSAEMKMLDDPTKQMEMLFALIDMLKINLPIDSNRIYLSGLSMGGYGTFDAIVRRPHEFAAAMPICGGGDVAKVSEITHLPMWIFHGAKDEVVDPDYSRNIFQGLKDKGGKVKYTEYPEARHDSWTNAFAEPDYLSWMFDQKKDE